MNMKILKILSQYNFEQLLDANLDVILCNADSFVLNCCRDKSLSDSLQAMGRALSDHQPYCIELDLSITAFNRPSSTQFSYSRVDWEDLANYFRTHKFSPYCYSSVDVLTCSWYKRINDGIAQHVPKRTKHRRNLPPWTSQATSNLIKIANTRRKHVDYSNATTVARLRTAEVSAMNALNHDKQQYECDVFSSRNFGDLYRYFKSVKRSSTLPDKMHWNQLEAATDIDKADLFNK